MSNLFHKSTTPKNSLQILQWLIFEPVLFKRYEKTLTKIQTVIIILKTIFINFFIVIIPLTLVLYVIGVIIIAFFDWPSIFFPDAPRNIETNEVFAQWWEEKIDFFVSWQTYSTWWKKADFFVSDNNYNRLKVLVFGLAIGLVVGLTFGLVSGLIGNLAVGLVVGLAGGLIGSFAFGLTSGLIFSLTVGFEGYLAFDLISNLTICLVVGLALGLAVGLTSSLAEGLVGGLVFCLIFTLVEGLTVGLVENLVIGLVFLLFFYLSYFRLWFYPWHFLNSLMNVSLTNNPYMGDGVIRLSIWGMTGKLTAQAQQYPATGLALVNFLQEYRPLQRQLAMHIAHAATASNWQSHPLQLQYLLPPPFIEETPRLTPSKLWLSQLEKLNRQFDAYEKEHQPSLKKEQLEIFCTQLAQFRDLTERESYRWHYYYFPAINEWQIAAKAKLTELAQKTSIELITS